MSEKEVKTSMTAVMKLKEIIENAHRIVVFTGAGISCASGIPDFRSSDGLYNQKGNLHYSPEEIISHSFFVNRTQEFYDFYRSKMLYPNALPNAAHKYIASLEATKDVTVITQNIDALHHLAGSKQVYELHGNIQNNYCMKCHKYYPLSKIIATNDVPHCDCGGIIKPNVVLYEEELDYATLINSIKAIEHADTMIVIGTSLVVYPAAGLIRYFHGQNLIIINKEKTPSDNLANLVINEDIIKVVNQLL